MGNVPVQAINSLLGNHTRIEKTPSADPINLPKSLKENQLEESKSTEVDKNTSDAEQVDSIATEPVEATPQHEEVSTLIPNPRPTQKVVDEIFQNIDPVKTIAPDVLTTIARGEEEALSKGIGITAHGRVK